MNVLVTGGAGYLGSVLVPKLLARGHRVKVLDIGYFGVGHLRAFRPTVELVRDDVGRVSKDAKFRDELLDGIDCIIHLAAISNDPSAELNPELTEQVNLQGTLELADIARARGIRFLFSSSCSVYGEAPGELNEDSALDPLTVYAVSKVKAERALEQMASTAWRPISLRNGTLFGHSPRMRFDLVVNIFSLYSTLYNEIKIFGPGMQWRPYLHVNDCARAFVHFAESQEYRHSIYNIANENLRVVDVATIFQRINPRLKAVHLDVAEPDHRDYRVAAVRMKEDGFEPRLSVEVGATTMVEAIVTGLIPDPESIYYRNAKWLKELSEIGNRSHRDILGLIETISTTRPAPGV
jgi:nucleoside-diphosphate-sugar epimerase